MKNVRNKQNIRLVADPTKVFKAVSKFLYKRAVIINADLVIIKAEL